MDVIELNPSEIEAVFGLQLDGRSLEEVAAQSSKIFVQSQIQIAFDNELATGVRLVAQDALRRFGWGTLRQLAHRNAAPIISSAADLGNKFTEKRNILGLKLADAASIAKIDPEDLNLLEEGRKKFPIRKIERLAQRLSVEPFSKESVSEGERALGLRLRNYGHIDMGVGVFSPSLVMHLSELGWIIKKQSELQKLSGFDSESAIRELGFTPSDKYEKPPYKWGYKLAHRARQLLGLSQGEPIQCLRSLIEDKLGIPIIQSDLPILFAGATISNGNVRGIVLNLQGYNESPWIRRVTLSHELGHLLWDPAEKLNSLRVDTFDAIEHSAEELGDPVEARANAFAAEFLAPRAAVSEFIQDCSSDEVAIQAVCEHFGVGPGTARLQIQNASNEKRFVDHLRFKISPNERWYSIENFTADYLPGAENVPVNRRGKFSYWVAKSAIDNLISFDTAGLYLGVDFPLDSEKAKSIASLFTAQTI